jgi:hypothetical protein
LKLIQRYHYKKKNNNKKERKIGLKIPLLIWKLTSYVYLGDHYSAMVLATAGSAVYPRQLVQRQLQEWVGGSISTLVNTQRLRAWLLSGAGLPLLALEDGETLNALQGLDWIYCLAAHFWYVKLVLSSCPNI